MYVYSVRKFMVPMTFSHRHSFLNRKTLFKICAFAFITLFPSCSTYQNITSYFNTYYNASKLFDDAVTEIEKAPQKDRDTNYFAAYTISKGVEDKLDKVIEKCSKLIQFYPQSKLIDDAILMIGKAYVYKGESESALRKFNELLQNFPLSDQRFAAKLWSAKAHYHAKQDDEVLKIVKELFPEARAEGKNDILLETLMLEAQTFFDRNEYDQAAATYSLAIEVSGDDHLRAIAAYQLGLCYERLREYEKAGEAYGRVKKFSPEFAVEFRARLKQGSMLSTNGHYDSALKRFDELKDEALKNDELGLVELEIANTFRRMGDTSRAFAIYNNIDTTFKHTEASAKSFYQRARVFETEYLDFQTARMYYDKAKSEFPTAEITPLAQQKAASFSSYFTSYDNLHRYDSILFITLHPESIKVKHDSLKVAIDSLHSKADSGKSNTATLRLPDSLDSKVDSLKSQKSPVVHEQRAPNYRPPDIPNELMAPPVEKTGGKITRESSPDTVGEDSLVQSGSVTDSLRALARGHRPRVDSLARGVDSLKRAATFRTAPAQEKLSPDSLRALIVRTKFELAGLFLLELNHPDSALFWYREVVRSDSSSRLVPRALYAMAEIYRENNDSSNVDSLYTIILDQYNRTDYAAQVRKVKGMDTVKTEVDPAIAQYEIAENLLQSGKAKEGLDHLRLLVDTYPTSSIAPKALYAVGWIYESILVQQDSVYNDSAAVWYKKLIKAFPSSVYATVAQPKVAVKDDPKSLSQYVKIKEIPTFGKQEPATRQRQNIQSDSNKNQGQEEDLQRNRRLNRDEEDDEKDDEEEEPPDPDDNN